MSQSVLHRCLDAFQPPGSPEAALKRFALVARASPGRSTPERRGRVEAYRAVVARQRDTGSWIEAVRFAEREHLRRAAQQTRYVRSRVPAPICEHVAGLAEGYWQAAQIAKVIARR